MSNTERVIQELAVGVLHELELLLPEKFAVGELEHNLYVKERVTGVLRGMEDVCRDVFIELGDDLEAEDDTETKED